MYREKKEKDCEALVMKSRTARVAYRLGMTPLVLVLSCEINGRFVTLSPHAKRSSRYYSCSVSPGLGRLQLLLGKRQPPRVKPICSTVPVHKSRALPEAFTSKISDNHSSCVTSSQCDECIDELLPLHGWCLKRKKSRNLTICAKEGLLSAAKTQIRIVERTKSIILLDGVPPFLLLAIRARHMPDTPRRHQDRAAARPRQHPSTQAYSCLYSGFHTPQCNPISQTRHASLFNQLLTKAALYSQNPACGSFLQNQT